MSSPAELISLARRARHEHRLADAKDCFKRAVDAIRNAGDKALLADALCGLGQIERDQGNGKAALEHDREAVGLRRSGGDTPALAHTIRHVADILREQESAAKAAPYYEKAISIYRSHPDTTPLDLANAIRGLALLKASSASPGTQEEEQAILLWREAAGLYEQAGVSPGIAECRQQIAFLLGR